MSHACVSSVEQLIKASDKFAKPFNDSALLLYRLTIKNRSKSKMAGH